MASEDVRQAARDAEEFRPEPPRPLTREIPEPEEYPVESLGDVLAPTARAIQALSRVPLAIAAQSSLGAANLAVQGHADVVLPTGSQRPLSEYFLTIAASGERKSEADRLALRGVNEKERSLHDAYPAELSEWKNRHDAWKGQRTHIAGRGSQDQTAQKREALLGELGPEPEPPPPPILTAPDPTFEGLIKLLFVGHPSVGIFSDEGGQLIGGYGMRAEQQLMTASGLSKLWDGDQIKRVRAGDGASSLFGRRVCSHLMTQPGVAARLLSNRELIDQGLISRFLPSRPTSAMGTRFWKDPDPADRDQLARFASVVRFALDAPLPLREGTQNELLPRDLTLSPDATRLWTGFADHIEGLIGEDGPLAPIRGLANKAAEHAGRLAGTIRLIDDLDSREITPRYMEAGIHLVQFYLSEGLRLHEAAQVSPRLEMAQRVLDWLVGSWRHPVVSLPNIYQLGPRQVRDKDTAQRVTATLEDHGWLQRIEDGAMVAGVMRRDAWRIVRTG